VSQLDDLRDEYLYAVSELFTECTHDHAFEIDEAFKNAAIAAQYTLGKVEIRSSLDDSKLSPEQQALSADEFRKIEGEFKAAVETLLGKASSMDNDQIISAAQRVAEIKRRFDKNR
jgi:hypothetical protein